VTQCTLNCDINRLRTPQNQIGTAFGTARFIWLSLSADDASLFRRVRSVHLKDEAINALHLIAPRYGGA
jgi:hypothetical protein